jgi:hypothetical protein
MVWDIWTEYTKLNANPAGTVFEPGNLESCTRH